MGKVFLGVPHKLYDLFGAHQTTEFDVHSRTLPAQCWNSLSWSFSSHTPVQENPSRLVYLLVLPVPNLCVCGRGKYSPDGLRCLIMFLIFLTSYSDASSTFTALPYAFDTFVSHPKLCIVSLAGLLCNMTRSRKVHACWCFCTMILLSFTSIEW